MEEETSQLNKVIEAPREGKIIIMGGAKAATKVPVIATRVGAAPEMIEDGVSGFLVDPRDTEAIANRINRLALDERLRQEIAICAHQKVLKEFGALEMIQKIQPLIE